MPGPRAEARHAARTARARHLASRRPEAREALDFYERLAAFQPTAIDARAGADLSAPPDGSLRATIDPAHIVPAIASLLTWLSAHAPPTLAAEAVRLRDDTPGRWRQAIDAYLASDGGGDESETPRGFVVEAAVQPAAEALADRWAPSGAADAGEPGRCPVCGQRPLLAVLREAGHGAVRALLCGLCATEWRAPRLGCHACGEARFEALPVFQAEAMPGVRIDACDTCRAYLKTVDLVRDGAAVPLVDDLASLSLDLWARAGGYRRRRPNLLRL